MDRNQCSGWSGIRINLLRALNRGLLPSIYFSDDAQEDLKAYTGTYLQQEISAEGLTRNVPAFSRFLQVAALCNGKLINYTNIANDAQVARSTVQEYFRILKDTLIAHEVPAWTRSTRRKSIGASKFYLFDVGVTRFLQNRGEIKPRSPEFGEAFESYMFHEFKSYSDHSGTDSPAPGAQPPVLKWTLFSVARPPSRSKPSPTSPTMTSKG